MIKIRSHKYIVLLAVVLAFLTAAGTLGSIAGMELKYESHDVIIVNSDSELAAMASSEGWQGDGSAANPYLIQGYDINATGRSVGIYLGNTTSHVVIRDCRVHGAQFSSSSPYYWRDGAGIKIYSASNVRIVNCTFDSNDYGIYVYRGDSIAIGDGHFEGNDRTAITMASSGNLVLYGNTMVGESILLMGTRTELESMEIYRNNTVNGRPVYFYKGNAENETVPWDAGEVIAVSASYLRINGLEIHDASTPIQVFYSDHVYMTNLSIYNMKEEGIYAYSSSYLLVEHCEISNTANYGISFYLGGNSVIRDNDIHDIYGNEPSGVEIRSDGNIIEKNYIHNIHGGIGGVGVFLNSGSGNTVSENLLHDNRIGVRIGYVLESKNNTITRNTITNSSSYGIYITNGAGNTAVTNILAYNHGSTSTYSPTTVQAYDSVGNAWNTTIGNFWFDWAYNNYSNDNDNDNYVDWNYTIDGGAGVNDSKPLKSYSPSIPYDFEVREGDGYVNLTWKQPLSWGYSADSYNVYRDGTLVATLSRWVTYYNDTSVLNGQYYRYYVTAVNTRSWESVRTIERIAVPHGNSYVDHGVIRINNDTDLLNLVNSEGLKGSGTAWDPYIISGYSIDARGGGAGIYVGNTTLHFIIRNCHVYNATKNGASIYNVGAGIILYNLKNATISGNQIDGNRRGIAIYMATGEGEITVEDNAIVAGSSHYGILIYSTTNVGMRNNTMSNGGIYIYGNASYASTHTIEDNMVNGHPVYYYANLDGHGITVPRDAGEIIVANTSYLKVENVNLDGYGSDVLVLNSHHIYVLNSSLNHGSIVADTVTYGRILNNTLDGGHIMIRSFDSGFIEENELRNTENYNSIYMTFSDYNYVRWNVISGGDNSGIWVWSSSHNVIAGNQIYNASGKGIAVDGFVASEGNLLAKNVISGCDDYGIYLGAYGYGAVNTTIYGNSLYYNRGSTDSYDSAHVQAYDEGTGNVWNTTEGNYWADWTSPDSDHDGIVDSPYAVDGSANSEDALPKSLSVPAPPRNLTTIAGNGFVNLSWDMPVGNGSSEITSYRIYRNGTLLAEVPASQTWYNDTSVSNGVTYIYTVTAVNSAGESLESNEVYATPSEAIPEFGPLLLIGLFALLVLFRRH